MKSYKSIFASFILFTLFQFLYGCAYQSKEKNVKCITQENVISLLFVDKMVIFAEKIIKNKNKEVHTKQSLENIAHDKYQ